MNGLISKAEFIGIENIAHLAAAGEAPVLISNVGAVSRFLFDKGIGMPGRDRMFATVARTKERLARLLNAAPHEIALLLNATAGLHAAADGIDWHPGDNVVMAASEFPSLLHIWQALGSGVVEMRLVGENACPTLSEVAAAVNAKTRAIVVSHVSYLTGLRVDLAALREIADRHASRLIVDASHSLGVVAVDGSLCDVVVSCCYKWLLGTHGIGVLFANSTRWPELQPKAVGWNSVVPEFDWRRRADFQLKSTMEKFEGGNSAFISAYYLENSLAVLERIGVSDIETYVLELGAELHRGVARLGMDVLTPARPLERAGSICIATNRAELLEAQLRDRGVLTWGEDGRLRISVHLYNDSSDVKKALAELKKLTP